MSGFSSFELFTRRGAPLLLAAGALGAALLAGCGGGGGNGNSGGGSGNSGSNSGNNSGNNSGGVQGSSSVIGKVTDVSGNGVPGVSIIPDSGGTGATSLGQGGYRLDNLSGNAIHRITASVTQNGTPYTGSTQVLTESSGSLVSNANILLSPVTSQATVSGSVTDVNGSGLGGVRVYLAVPNNGNYSSLVAYTDTKGNYTIPNVPINSPAGAPVSVAVSTPGYQTKTFTLPALQAGGGYNQSFVLLASTGTALGVPNVLGVFTATEPTDSQSGLLRARASASPSVYDHLRRLLSPAYARIADRTPAAGRRKAAHALGDYAVQTDVAFDPVTTGSVVGYTIYRSSGTTVPTQAKDSTNTPIYGYDFLQDPLANYYTDLTFSTNLNTTSADVQYNFALSATNTDNTETALSPVFSVLPLGPLTLALPTAGETLANPVTVSWSAVTGATKYYVFVYQDQYPSIGTSPVYATSAQTPLAATATSQTLSPLATGHDYYVVVVGAADQNEDLLPGQTTSSTPVGNAETTFSQITRFHL